MEQRYRISIRPGVVFPDPVFKVQKPGETLVSWTCMSLPEAFDRIARDLRERGRHLSHDLDVYTPNVPVRELVG